MSINASRSGKPLKVLLSTMVGNVFSAEKYRIIHLSGFVRPADVVGKLNIVKL